MGLRAQDGSTAAPRPENPCVCAIVVQEGTCIPDIIQTVDIVKARGKRWKNKVIPFRVTRSMGSTISAVLAKAFKVQGASFFISSIFYTEVHCIGIGYKQTLIDNADVAF